MKMKNSCTLPFLEVLAERKGGSFITSLYRMPTVTGLYSNQSSFVPQSRKITLISTLTDRALMLCSCRLDRVDEHKIKRSEEPVVFCLCLCPIYLKLPQLGRNSHTLADRVSACVRSGFSTDRLHVIFGVSFIFQFFFKSSFVLYKFKWQSDTEYLGRTNRRLETRIGPYVLVSMRLDILNNLVCAWSAIAQHFLDNPDRINKYANRFSQSFTEFGPLFIYTFLKRFTFSYINRLCANGKSILFAHPVFQKVHEYFTCILY